MRIRRGFTLVEMLVAALLTTVLMGGVFSMLGGGNQLFTRGLQVAVGRQAALLFFEQLEEDLAACIVVPGHQGNPVAISTDGRRLAFYRTNRQASTMQITVGSPVDYGLSGDLKKEEDRNPVRNGLPMKIVAVRDVRFELIEPDAARKRPSWMVATVARFPEGGLTGRIVTVKRLVELVQPTSLSRYSNPLFVDDVTPLSFVMLEAPDEVRKLLARSGLGPGVGPAPLPPPPSVAGSAPTTAAAAPLSPPLLGIAVAK